MCLRKHFIFQLREIPPAIPPVSMSSKALVSLSRYFPVPKKGYKYNKPLLIGVSYAASKAPHSRVRFLLTSNAHSEWMPLCKCLQVILLVEGSCSSSVCSASDRCRQWLQWMYVSDMVAPSSRSSGPRSFMGNLA